MGFDWDPAKNVSNRRKHDITFERASAVFDDPARVAWICSDPGDAEERWMVVGRVGWRIVSVVYAERGDTTRLISARKASPGERRVNDDGMIRARRTPDGRLEQILPDGSTRPLEDNSDWARFDAITDDQAYQNAMDDPDNPPLTPERLARMRRVPNPRNLRLSLGLTQEEFSRQFEITLGTLREWESGARHLDRTAVSYLTVIEKNPDAVRQALGTDTSERPVAEEVAESRPKRVG